MLGGLGPPWIRAGGYAVAAVVCAIAGWRDTRRRASGADGWPAFWFATSAFFVVLAVGRAADWGDLLSEVGRRDARSGGWYDNRRDLQLLAVAGVLGVSLLAGIVAVHHVLRRGRARYLPLMVVAGGLGAFVGIRLASLHQIDALLHNRSVDGLQIGAGLELVGIGLAVCSAVALLAQHGPVGRNPVAPPP